MDVNIIILIGRIGSDLNLKEAKSGNKYMKISVATNRGKDDVTDWHNVTLFGGTAEAIYNYGRKGAKIYIEGSMNVDKVEYEDGNKVFFNVAARRAILLENKKSENSSEDSENKDSTKDPITGMEEEEYIF